MYYPDLALCDYHSGPYDAASWRVPLCSIGWLESSHEHERGVVDETFLEKLKGFVFLSRAKYSHLRFRGVHHCSLCGTDTLAALGIGWSQEIIIVPGKAVVYAAPGGIIHYIESHEYLPPSEFIEAVMFCPEYGSADYQIALRHSNGGEPPPMVTNEEWRADFQRQIAETLRLRKQIEPKVRVGPEADPPE